MPRYTGASGAMIAHRYGPGALRSVVAYGAAAVPVSAGGLTSAHQAANKFVTRMQKLGRQLVPQHDPIGGKFVRYRPASSEWTVQLKRRITTVTSPADPGKVITGSVSPISDADGRYLTYLQRKYGIKIGIVGTNPVSVVFR